MKNYLQFLESINQKKIYYHGSGTPIVGKFKPTESKRGLTGQVYKNQIYFFTDDIRVAEIFAKDRSTDGKGFITRVYLSVSNTLDLSEDEDFVDEFLKNKLFPEQKEWEGDVYLEQVWTWFDDPEVVEKVKGMGYDSVKLAEPILDSTSIGVFDPDKIHIIS